MRREAKLLSSARVRGRGRHSAAPRRCPRVSTQRPRRRRCPGNARLTRGHLAQGSPVGVGNKAGIRHINPVVQRLRGKCARPFGEAPTMAGLRGCRHPRIPGQSRRRHERTRSSPSAGRAYRPLHIPVGAWWAGPYGRPAARIGRSGRPGNRRLGLGTGPRPTLRRAIPAQRLEVDRLSGIRRDGVPDRHSVSPGGRPDAPWRPPRTPRLRPCARRRRLPRAA
jgi:hypothetical protein